MQIIFILSFIINKYKYNFVLYLTTAYFLKVFSLGWGANEKTR